MRELLALSFTALVYTHYLFHSKQQSQLPTSTYMVHIEEDLAAKELTPVCTFHVGYKYRGKVFLKDD